MCVCVRVADNDDSVKSTDDDDDDDASFALNHRSLLAFHPIMSLVEPTLRDLGD